MVRTVTLMFVSSTLGMRLQFERQLFGCFTAFLVKLLVGVALCQMLVLLTWKARACFMQKSSSIPNAATVSLWKRWCGCVVDNRHRVFSPHVASGSRLARWAMPAEGAAVFSRLRMGASCGRETGKQMTWLGTCTMSPSQTRESMASFSGMMAFSSVTSLSLVSSAHAFPVLHFLAESPIFLDSFVHCK